jgi:hypothetical protein
VDAVRSLTIKADVNGAYNARAHNDGSIKYFADGVVMVIVYDDSPIHGQLPRTYTYCFTLAMLADYAARVWNSVLANSVGFAIRSVGSRSDANFIISPHDNLRGRLADTQVTIKGYCKGEIRMTSIRKRRIRISQPNGYPNISAGLGRLFVYGSSERSMELYESVRIMIHEMGHALGLSHPEDSGDRYLRYTTDDNAGIPIMSPYGEDYYRDMLNKQQIVTPSDFSTLSPSVAEITLIRNACGLG